jgi:hypothetical protein
MLQNVLEEQKPAVHGTTIIRKWTINMDDFNDISDNELNQIMRELDDAPEDELEYMADEELDDEEVPDEEIEDLDAETDLEESTLKDYL